MKHNHMYIFFSAILYSSLVEIAYCQVQRFGTAIGIVRTNNQIIVGADSRVNVLKGAFEFEDRDCKIFQFRDFFFTYSGFNSDDPQFDPTSIAKNCLDSGRSIMAMAECFEGKLKRELTPVLTSFLQKESQFWARIKKAGFAYAIMGFENETPCVISASFKITESTGVLVELERRNVFTRMSDREFFIVLGEQSKYDQIKDHMGTTLSKFSDYGSFIRWYINEQSSLTPHRVGGHVDILLIEKSGAKWINPDSRTKCPEVISMNR